MAYWPGRGLSDWPLPRLRDPDRGEMWGWTRPLVPPPQDATQLVSLLRQATDAMELALVTVLAPVMEASMAAPLGGAASSMAQGAGREVILARQGLARARTLDDVHLLRALQGRPRPSSQLAALLGRTPQTIAHRLRRLEAAALVSRERDYRDSRVVMVGLTVAGAELVVGINLVIDQLTHLWAEDVAEVEGLEIEVVNRVLERMVYVR